MGVVPSPALIALGALWLFMIGGATATVAIGPAVKRQRVFKRRVAGLTRHRAGADAAVNPGEMRLTRTARSAGSPGGLRTMLMPRHQMLSLRLERTGRAITIAHYIGASLAIALAVGAIFGLAFKLGPMPGALCGILAGIAIPHIWIGRMGKNRVTRFMMLLPEAIDLMVRALRSGLPISEAIVNAGHEVADPVGSEFRRVESSLRMGRELDDVLWDTARRLDVPEFRFFVISMGVQRETGGNLAETLATLADMLRRRRQMKLKIKALSAEGRASAMILGGLPFAVSAIMMVTSPDYIGRIFTDPRGLILCAAGLVLMGIGIAVMAKIINFEI